VEKTSLFSKEREKLRSAKDVPHQLKNLNRYNEYKAEGKKRTLGKRKGKKTKK